MSSADGRTAPRAILCAGIIVLDEVFLVERFPQPDGKAIAPGNVLGLPSVALPAGIAGGLPTGIQIYADLWREDLCLSAAEIVEAGFGAASPIDPVRE